MSGTINHLFNPGDSVFVISGEVGTDHVCPLAIEPATIIQFTAVELLSTTTLTYGCRVGTDLGMTEYAETDIFPSLAAAITEYQTRLT